MNKYSVIFFFGELSAVIIISFRNLPLIGSCEENKEKHGTNEVCGMVGRTWLPFEYDYIPMKPIVFSYEVCNLFDS